MSSRPRPPKVGLKWEAREDEKGRRYAILRWTEDGKRKSRPIGYQTPNAAEEMRKDHEAALRLGVASPIDSFVRVGDVLTRYLTELERRPVSRDYQERELDRCITLRRMLGHLPVDAVSATTMARYVGDRRRETIRRGKKQKPDPAGRTPKRASLMAEVDTLRRAYRTLIDLRLIDGPVPPLPTGKIPNDARPPRRLTEAEVAKLIVAAHEDDEFGHWRSLDRGLGWMLQVMAWSGRRPVAVLDVHVEDLARLLDPSVPREDQLVYWRRDKGGEGLGWGPVTEPARDALVARAGEVGSGRLWNVPDSSHLVRPLRRVAGAAGVAGVQVYDLRRFAVTQILRACGGLTKVARKYTGHQQDSTLLRYAYAAEGEAEALAARIGWTPEPLQLVATAEDEATGRSDGRNDDTTPAGGTRARSSVTT